MLICQGVEHTNNLVYKLLNVCRMVNLKSMNEHKSQAVVWIQVRRKRETTSTTVSTIISSHTIWTSPI